MFQSAIFKLTAWYLLIVMLISVGFSASIYNLSAREIDQRLRRQAKVYSGFILPEMHMEEIEQAREDIFSESEDVLLAKLLYLNLLVLITGGLGSYFLAKYTLQPIKEAHEAQSRFTSDASHELRTPLTVLKTEIEVALRSSNNTKKDLQETLESNLEEVDKLKYLTDSLLKLSANKGSVASNLEVVSVQKVVSSAVKLSNKVAKNKHITLVQNIAEEKVLGLEGELREVLLILLDNAVKYSPKKSAVKIGCQENNEQVIISVKDQGCGINEADQERIFKRFYRVEGARSKDGQGGFGLGLAIAKQLVELMNGKITVDSKVGAGSEFKMYLAKA